MVKERELLYLLSIWQMLLQNTYKFVSSFFFLSEFDIFQEFILNGQIVNFSQNSKIVVS